VAMTLVGPFIAIVMILAVAALMHRSLRARPAPPMRPLAAKTRTVTEVPPKRPVAGAPPKPPAEVKPTKLTDYLADDYGLLATAAVARTQADALLVKEHLRSAGIRATLATAPDGQIRVLVFGDEVVRARRLVGQ
jgi:hypothetical protein